MTSYTITPSLPLTVPQYALAQIMNHPTEVRSITYPAGTYIFSNVNSEHSTRVKTDVPRRATIEALIRKGVLKPITYVRHFTDGRLPFENTVLVYAFSYGLPTFICNVEQAWDEAHAENENGWRIKPAPVELPPTFIPDYTRRTPNEYGFVVNVEQAWTEAVEHQEFLAANYARRAQAYRFVIADLKAIGYRPQDITADVLLRELQNCEYMDAMENDERLRVTEGEPENHIIGSIGETTLYEYECSETAL